MTAPAPPPVVERPRPRPAAQGARARMADAPKAPWSPFPLTELVILLAMALIVGGVLTDGGRRGALLGCGFALVSLAGLELAVREHFAGYRSHSTLLAAASAIVVDAPLFLWTGLPQIALLAIGIAVFVAVLTRLRRAFRARSGGVGFRA
jgi:hypothetical protein